MKRKGFTLVELLVVIAIIALLMGILMPALTKVRQLAGRIVCGSNLSGIGRAILVYANDYDETYPVSGGRNAPWDDDGEILAWDGDGPTEPGTEVGAFGPTGGGSNPATITSCFYLLVRYADCQPKQFICKGDGASEFRLADYTSDLIDSVTEAWDFGTKPSMHCSYSYNLPFRNDYMIDASSPAACAVAADRNPFLDKNAEEYLGDSDVDDPTCDSGQSRDTDRKWNSAAHQREGQNVLFNDAHVAFQRNPFCGIDNDNIWQCWPNPAGNNDSCEKQIEGTPDESDSDTTIVGDGDTPKPESEKDSYLVNEHQDYGTKAM